MSPANRIEIAGPAADELHALISIHSLPPNTLERVQRVLQGLEQFPKLGRELGGRFADCRSLLGPWRGMLLIYEIVSPEERIVVVSVQDARSGGAARGA